MSFLHQEWGVCFQSPQCVIQKEEKLIQTAQLISSHSGLLEEPDLILLIKKRHSSRGDFVMPALSLSCVQSACRSSFKESLVKQDKTKSLESKVIFHMP